MFDTAEICIPPGRKRASQQKSGKACRKAEFRLSSRDERCEHAVTQGYGKGGNHVALQEKQTGHLCLRAEGFRMSDEAKTPTPADGKKSEQAAPAPARSEEHTSELQ